MFVNFPAEPSAFQSTRPRGARPAPQEVENERIRRFNPRAREGRDDVVCLIRQCGDVSIHAPARGATAPQEVENERIRRFNPRAREGRDEAVDIVTLTHDLVSIHAPARGATSNGNS